MQNLKYFFAAIALIATLASCDKYDIQGFFVSPSKERINERFSQSIEYNNQHLDDTLIVCNNKDYRFYIASDVHVKTTAHHLALYLDVAAQDAQSAFTFINGDITDQKGGLQIAYDTLQNHKANSIVRTTSGNHDVYFEQWTEFYNLFGSTAYYFIVKTPDASDLFIVLDSSCGTLGSKQLKWLDELLADKRTQHRHCFVLTHTHFFDREMSQFPTGNYSIEETAMLTNLFTKNNVNWVINGHDHTSELVELNNVTYLVLDDIQDLDTEPTYFIINVSANEITSQRTLLLQ